MNRETALKHTASYEDNLIERLKDPELARAYLEAALASYEADYDTEALLLAMRDVAKAQEGIKLAECGCPPIRINLSINEWITTKWKVESGK
jgi:hypothetical protein